MALSYNLGYQESISVHPTRRQIFAGKPYSTFPNIWEWLISRFFPIFIDGYSIPETSGLPKISNNTQYFGLPSSWWVSKKILGSGSGMGGGSPFGTTLIHQTKPSWIWLLFEQIPKLSEQSLPHQWCDLLIQAFLWEESKCVNLPIVHRLGGVCNCHKMTIPHQMWLVGMICKKDAVLVNRVPVDQYGQHHWAHADHSFEHVGVESQPLVIFQDPRI